MSPEDRAEMLEQRIAARERLLFMAVDPSILALLDGLQLASETERNRQRRMAELHQMRCELEEVRHEIELRHIACDYAPCQDCRAIDRIRTEQP